MASAPTADHARAGLKGDLSLRSDNLDSVFPKDSVVAPVVG
jgi:hypothetical protein